MQNFNATLIRELFLITSVHDASAPPYQGRCNRLAFECYRPNSPEPTHFIIRAQNIHTALKIGSDIVQHWLENGHLSTEQENPFDWEKTYNNNVKDFEKKWNPACWACVYQDGHKLFQSKMPEKTQFFDIIESVYAGNRKEDYTKIAANARDIYMRAGKNVNIEYEYETAMQLSGTPAQIINRITYRDVDGRNKIDLLMQQKNLQSPTNTAAPIHFSEALNIAALIFEGYQLGFLAGRTNYEIASGRIGINDPQAQQAQQAFKRVLLLEKSVRAISERYNIYFKPKPHFQQNIMNIENAFREKNTRQ